VAGLTKHASLLDVVKTVLAGFVGVRRKDAHEQARVSPLHVVIAAVVCVALFVATLVTIVRIVTH
jgi:DUF2970 family protein